MGIWFEGALKAVGAESDIRDLIAFLSPSVRESRGGPPCCSLDIRRLFDDIDPETDQCIFLRGFYPTPPPPNMVEDGGFYRLYSTPEGSAAWVARVEAEYAPPLMLAAKLSRRFPRLAFSVEGTTEHEFFECWEGSGGRLVRTDACTNHLPSDRETWHVKDGVVLDAKWAEHGVIEV